jgi:hypothetical protein
MRKVMLSYRVHVTDLKTARQYYFGYHRTKGNEGYQFGSREEADRAADVVNANPTYLADVEEYEV